MKRNLILAVVFLSLFAFLTGVGCTGAVDEGYCRGIGQWILCSRDCGIGVCVCDTLDPTCMDDDDYMEGITYIKEGEHYDILQNECVAVARRDKTADVVIAIEMYRNVQIDKLYIYILDDQGNVVGTYYPYNVICEEGVNYLQYTVEIPFYEQGDLTVWVEKVEAEW